MADTVVNRTVFMERDKNGYFRFADWALVTTKDNQTMAEPFTPRHNVVPGDKGVEFDASDDCAMITGFQNINADLLPTILSGGGPVWVGDVMAPRVGR